MRRTDSIPRRSGFTLVELMIVITIILALMALSASAVMKVMTVQANNTTQTTLDKVQSLLNRQWSAAKDQALKEAIPANVQTYITTNLAGTDANATLRVRVIYVKLRMRQLFPMSFNEALNPAPLPPLQGYVTYLGNLGITGSLPAYGSYQAYPHNFESSACLLMALQTAQGGGGSGTSDIGGGGSSSTFGLPTSGQTISAFVDAWGQPLYFSRVPAGCPAINTPPSNVVPGGGLPGANDPGDPQGYLNAIGWGLSSAALTFSNLTLQPLALQNCSYRLLPMVASSGQDKQISDPLWFSATQLIDNDNMFSNP
jgi:prepilin-type N-terminal cleavage/methylation domain-containing protein